MDKSKEYVLKCMDWNGMHHFLLKRAHEVKGNTKIIRDNIVFYAGKDVYNKFAEIIRSDHELYIYMQMFHTNEGHDGWILFGTYTIILNDYRDMGIDKKIIKYLRSNSFCAFNKETGNKKHNFIRI